VPARSGGGHGRSPDAGGVALWVALMLLTAGPGLAARAGEPLPTIGPAPAFSLTREDGRPLSLGDLRGKVVAVTFIYTGCADRCPLLTATMATLQKRLGAEFGSKVFFVSITVDPDRDTPDVLRRYAQAHGANASGWAFLTGRPAEIGEVVKRYGAYARKRPGGDVDHTFLTSLVDRTGTVRVQYLGARFDADDMLRDLRRLLEERGW
jgi:protein SCO1